MVSDNRGNIGMDQRENCNIECCDEAMGRRLAEQRLSEQERRYRDIFHNISDAVYLLEVTEDGCFRYLETNRAFEKHAGVPENGLLGQYVGDLLRSSGAETVTEQAIASLRRCLQVGERIEEEITLDLPTGRCVCYTTLTPLFDDAGRVNRILGISRDITERKRSDQQNGFMTFALDQAHDAVFLVDPQAGFQFRYVNDQACLSLGYSREELLAMRVPDIDPHADLKVATRIDEQIREQSLIRFETSHKTKDGQIFPVEISGANFEYEGQAMGLAIVRDISERKRLEEQLKMKEFALDHARDAVFLVDSDNRFVYVNEEASRALGYSREELIGLTPFDIDPDITLERYLSIDEQNMAEGSVTFETRHRHRDGNVFPVEIRISWFDFQSRTLTLALARDISERKRMEAKFQQNLRFFESMDKINLAIQGSNDLDKMLSEVLETVLAIFDCDRAYLLYPCSPEDGPWQVPMERTRPEYPGALALGQDIPMSEEGAAFIRILLAEDGPATFGEGNQYVLSPAIAEPFDILSFMATAVYPKADKPWQFGIQQCSGARVWTAYEKKLFQEVGRRLSDALTGLLAFRNLQERERQFRTLAEGLPDYIARYDVQARKIYANLKLQQILGGNIDAWLGKTPKEVNPGGEYDEYQAKLDGVIKTGQPDEIAYMARDGHGDFRHHQIRFVAELGAYGEIVGALAIGRDVTRTRQLELELIKREREFRTLAENTPDVIVRYDRDCRRIYYNRAYEKLLNIAQAEVLGKTPGEYWRLVAPDADEYIAILRRVMETRRPEWIEIRLVDANGELRYRSLHLVPELTENNEVTSVLSVSTDITELKTVERRRMESREDERKLLARELHDDLGQRLTVLRMDVFRLGLRFGQDNPALMAQMQGLESEIAEAIQLIRNLVTMLRPAALDLGLVPALQWLVEKFRARSDIECHIELSTRAIALNDRQSMAIYRIVQESLTNVLKHAQAKRVRISLDRRDKAYVLEICDDGKGFVPISSKKTDSFGLKGIEERVQLLGGELVVETAPGCGTKLTIIISAPQLID